MPDRLETTSPVTRRFQRPSTSRGAFLQVRITTADGQDYEVTVTDARCGWTGDAWSCSAPEDSCADPRAAARQAIEATISPIRRLGITRTNTHGMPLAYS